MRKLSISLPVITIDPNLVKSTAERNRDCNSEIGDLFDIFTPLNTKVEPLPLPKLTATEKPDDWENCDRTTPLEALIQPKTGLLRKPEEIEAWIRSHLHTLGCPNHYIGGEANTDDPALYNTADLRVLVVRLSSYDSVNGSLTHGALAQAVHEAAAEKGFKVYVDFAFMPALMKDSEILTEHKVPWLYGHTSKRHPCDFDILLTSTALTMECWNIFQALIHSGIPPFKTMRKKELPIADPNGYPIVLVGGVVSDFVEVLYGKVAGEECIPDITIVGDGEYTLPLAIHLLQDCKQKGKTKAEFFRLGHEMSQSKHFEREEQGSWWYEPDLYEHIYQKSEKTGYSELIKIERKPGHDYAAAPGKIKRAVVRDMNAAPVWTDTPIQYDGSLGPSADIQISSGCLSGGLCSFCHVPGTPVVLADGSTKPIEDVDPGTAIITVHGTIRPVVHRYEREVDEEIGVWQVECMPAPVKTTLNHRVPAIKREHYEQCLGRKACWDDFQEFQLGDLAVGDLVAGPESTPDYPIPIVVSVLEKEHYKGKVYNLEVSDDHSYRVGDIGVSQEMAQLVKDIRQAEQEQEGFIQELMQHCGLPAEIMRGT